MKNILLLLLASVSLSAQAARPIPPTIKQLKQAGATIKYVFHDMSYHPKLWQAISDPVKIGNNEWTLCVGDIKANSPAEAKGQADNYYNNIAHNRAYGSGGRPGDSHIFFGYTMRPPYVAASFPVITVPDDAVFE